MSMRKKRNLVNNLNRESTYIKSVKEEWQEVIQDADEYDSINGNLIERFADNEECKQKREIRERI